jgi:hypothetical protein
MRVKKISKLILKPRKHDSGPAGGAIDPQRGGLQKDSTQLMQSCLVLLIGLASLGMVACQSSEPEATVVPPVEVATEVVAETAVVEVIVEDYSFLAPPTLKSGWNTFRMTNKGEQPHFMLLYRLPEGVTFGDYTAQLSRPFQGEYDRYTSGEATQEEFLESLGGVLPEWFGELKGWGGVGLTGPGRTSQSTVLLEAGDYVMECYVVSPEKQFHGTLGMLRPLIVNTESSGIEEPEADIQIALSNYEMTVAGDVTAGEHTVAVHATESAEGIIGHDVHLARLEPESSLEDLISWMNWIDALRSPAPAEFLGGAEHLNAGQTSYFKVSLESGTRYAWISEGFASKGMVEEFVVD